MLAFNLGKRFNQSSAVDSHAGRLLAHGVSRIKSNRCHQIDFRFCSLNVERLFPRQVASGYSGLLGIRCTFQIVLLDFPVHSGLADPEQLGGAEAVTARDFQCPPNGVLFHLPQR